MAKRRRKVRTDRIIILLIAAAALIGCVVTAVSCIGKKSGGDQPDSSASSQKESSFNVQNVEGYQILHDAGLSDDEIQQMVQLPYYWPERAQRYAAYTATDSISKRVLDVNMDLDQEPYSNSVIVSDDSDMTLLVNKSHALPEGYVPSDLETMDQYACVAGEDYSCQDVLYMEMRSEALQAYYQWCEAAAQQGIYIRAIAGYRSYDYQNNLWSYYAGLYGEEYADTYYARPGQSEHNSGLAVDITFNGYNFNEIELYDGYDWILNSAHEYGFILRYPEDQQDVTRYGYESWHFRYVGKETAKIIYENNWTLEEYHGTQEKEKTQN